MDCYVGTSGYAFKEWKGVFYPPKTRDPEMLGFYASQFRAVEINNTFYRMPTEALLLDWATRVPEAFRFATKASQRITHYGQLRDVSDLTNQLAKTVGVLGSRLGPTLFQLPPHLKSDLPRLEAFLETLPRDWPVTIEFRHRSWFEDDRAIELLRSRAIALCISEQADFSAPVIATAGFGYLRLQRFDYDRPALERWAERIRATPWSTVYLFFKHDHTPGSGPLVAREMAEVLRIPSETPGPSPVRS